MPSREEKNYIIEYYQLGNFMKVSAMDPVTLTETSIVGAANASKYDLAQLAVRKLERMLAKLKMK